MAEWGSSNKERLISILATEFKKSEFLTKIAIDDAESLIIEIAANLTEVNYISIGKGFFC